MTTVVCIVVSALVCGLLSPLANYDTLLLYQLSAYRLNELFTAFRRKKFLYFLPSVIAPAGVFAFMAILYAFINDDWFYLSVSAVVAVSLILFIASYKRVKVKLALTKRFKRFIAVFSVFSAALSVLLTLSYPPLAALSPFIGGFAAFLLSHAVTSPIETKRNLRLISAARDKLASMDKLVKIGITGSYGKTGAKNVLKAFLSRGYSVCATPGNYNTPLGIAKTANEDLLCDDTAFIAEMGARYVGDIRELCEIVKPEYALVTAIGTQHLETFGSLEAILETKNELPESLPASGLAVFNGDNEGCATLYERCKCRRLISGRDEDAVQELKNKRAEDESVKRVKSGKSQRIKATQVHVKSKYDACYGAVGYAANGIEFTMMVGDDAVDISTRLLGDHIPSVITQCALLAVQLGVSLEEIKNAAAELKPVAHRLELLYNGDDVIIDDAYNGNESGALNALRVLNSFAPRTRVLITPGLVELGARQEEANRRLGAQAYQNCDYAIFVGPNAEILKCGAEEAEFEPERVFSVNKLSDAVDIYKKIKGEKAVLFENDLPDNY